MFQKPVRNIHFKVLKVNAPKKWVVGTMWKNIKKLDWKKLCAFSFAATCAFGKLWTVQYLHLLLGPILLPLRPTCILRWLEGLKVPTRWQSQGDKGRLLTSSWRSSSQDDGCWNVSGWRWVFFSASLRFRQICFWTQWQSASFCLLHFVAIKI